MQSTTVITEDKTTAKYFMSQPEIRMNVILMSICWMTCSFDYYMVSFLLKYFPGNIYINSIMSTLSESVAYILGGWMFAKFGVKYSFAISFGIAAVGGLGILFYEMSTHFYSDNPATGVAPWIFPFLVLLAKFGISSGFNICYVANPELFPLLFASTAIGFCNFLARGSTIFAPEVAELQSTTPMIIFSILCVLSLLSSFGLKT